jgi:hypothetical protein
MAHCESFVVAVVLIAIIAVERIAADSKLGKINN